MIKTTTLALENMDFFIEAQIQAIENIVKNAGWLDESPDGMIPIRDCYNSDPQIFTHSYFLICCIITELINKILKAIDKAHLLAMIKQYKLELLAHHIIQNIFHHSKYIFNKRSNHQMKKNVHQPLGFLLQVSDIYYYPENLV